MSSFLTPYDIANAALQMVGVPRISTFADLSGQAAEAAFLYDKARRAELRRFVWTFATRRAILRPVSSTVKTLTFPAYSNLTAYVAGDVVKYSNVIYTAIAGSTGEIPGVGGFSPSWEVYYGPQQAELHNTATVYFPGDMAYIAGTPDVVYRWVNRASGSNHLPPNATYWMAPAGVTTSALFASDPISFDPSGATSVNSVQRNMYRQPANFLRLAPQDAKKAAVARLGTTGGINYNDWEIENGYLLTTDTTGGLILRFIGDVQVVATMEDMFCMAVACRMALGLNERLTQRADLKQSITADYNRFVREAQAISAIEGGTTEPDIGVPTQQEQPQQPARR